MKSFARIVVLGALAFSASAWAASEDERAAIFAEIGDRMEVMGKPDDSWSKARLEEYLGLWAERDKYYPAITSATDEQFKEIRDMDRLDIEMILYRRESEELADKMVEQLGPSKVCLALPMLGCNPLESVK